MEKQFIGITTATYRQFSRCGSLHGGKVRSLSREGNNVNAEVAGALNTTEKNALLAGLLALSDDPLPHEKDADDFAANPFKNVTPDQAEAYIISNVTDLDSAKLAMIKIARATVYLLRKTNQG